MSEINAKTLDTNIYTIGQLQPDSIEETIALQDIVKTFGEQ